jgi:collagen triple helix repeat protein
MVGTIAKSAARVPVMKRTITACLLLSALALAGCSVKGDKGEKGGTGPKGDAGPMGPAGPQGPRGLQGPPGKDGKDGVSPPPQFRVVRSAADDVVANADCGSEEVMVAAICIVKSGQSAQTPLTFGDHGTSCDKAGQSEQPQAVILCAKR